MITCMPIRICTVTETTNSSMMMATSGEPRICATAAWLRPSSVIDDDDRGDGQWDVGDRGEALAPEIAGAGSGGAAAADPGERGADMLDVVAHRGPPIAKRPTIHSTTVIAIEPTRLAAASHSRSLGPKPRPVSQIKWRMPPSM